MFEPEIEYTYWPPEPPVPYEPYRGYTTDPSRSQQQSFASPPPRLTIQARAEQVKPTPTRMSKAEALELVDQCKRWLVAGSFVIFGVIAGLVAGQAFRASNAAGNQSNNQAAPSFNSPSTSPYDNGGFFQQGGNNFGNGNSGQQPSSGSHTS